MSQLDLQVLPLYPSLVVDFESTGLIDYQLPADHRSQPRITQVAAVFLDVNSLDPEASPVRRIMSRLIKPDGWEVPAVCADLNGITTEMCEAKGVPIAQALDELMELWAESAVFSSYGLRFDSKLLRGELRRAGRPDCSGLRPEVDLIQVAAAHLKSIGRGNGRWVKLKEAVSVIANREQHAAHEAQSDAYDAARLYYFFAKNGLLRPVVRKGKDD